MSRTAPTQLSIGPDHINLIHGDQITRIDDQNVLGVSTRVLRDEGWLTTNLQRRSVDIEYIDDDGNARTTSVDQILGSAENDSLAFYAKRVASHAAENSIQELVAKETVERKGFMINDQGVMLAASGSAFCGGLFDLQAIDYAGDHTLLWTEESLTPAAVLGMDDPNSLTLAKLLPRLIQEVDAEMPEFRHLVAHYKPDFHLGNSSKSPQIVTSVCVMAGGAISAVVTQLAFQQMDFLSLIATVMLAISPLALLGTFAWYLIRRNPTLFVFRRGLCFQRGKKSCEIRWDELRNIQLSDREVNLGNAQHPHYVRICTLRLHVKEIQFFGHKIKVEWTENEQTMVMTEFLRDRADAFKSARYSQKLDTESASAKDAELALV